MVSKGFIDFNFSFRLTFSDTLTRKAWYQSVTLSNNWQSPFAQGLFRKLLALNLIGFAAGAISLALTHLFYIGSLGQFEQFVQTYHCFLTSAFPTGASFPSVASPFGLYAWYNTVDISGAAPIVPAIL